jgi:hypothetical protein
MLMMPSVRDTAALRMAFIVGFATSGSDAAEFLERQTRLEIGLMPNLACALRRAIGEK